MTFSTAQKMKFSITNFFSKCGFVQETADLVTFAKEVRNGKLHFLRSFLYYIWEYLFWT